MTINNNTYKYHFFELRRRIIFVLLFFFCAFVLSYIWKEEICALLILPLQNIAANSTKIIYTSIEEGFFAYLYLSLMCASFLTMPFVSYQVYRFITPGLYSSELRIAQTLFIMAPVLFVMAVFLVYFGVMPTVWKFFLSFDSIANQPLIFEARISQYLSMSINLMMAFGLAFELPVVLIVLFLLKIITLQSMIEKRRISIVLNFILAGLITPPDVISQLMLAVPMCGLYEITILICRNIEKRTLKL